MRKFLTTLFAASAIALPATAATIPDSPQQRGHTRADSESPRADRGDRGNRGARPSNDGAQREQRGRPERPRMTAPQAETARPSQWPRPSMSSAPQAPAEVRTYQRRDRGAPVEVQRDGGIRRDSQWNRDRTGTVQRDTDRIRRDRPAGSFGTRVGTAGSQHEQWTRDWRNDRRYDWRDYRTRNRTAFRVGIYYDPYGTNYRRWNIGWSMRPYYYQSNYWIADPWQYRLPEAFGPYRWVRYYDDAILVDTFSGEVVDVIYNFFW